MWPFVLTHDFFDLITKFKRSHSTLQADEAVSVRPKKENKCPKRKARYLQNFDAKLCQNGDKLHLYPIYAN